MNTALGRHAASMAATVLGCLFLAAPTGLVWAAVAPRLRIRLEQDGPVVLGIGRQIIGADVSFLAVTFVAGLVTGLLAWVFCRRSGPWTVLALLFGGLLAAYFVIKVGVLPEPTKAHVRTLIRDPDARGTIDSFVVLKSHYAVVAWPVGALLAFVAGALRRPEELD